jgi:two-component system, LytTR family, response regulator
MILSNSNKTILLLPTCNGIEVIDINLIVRIEAISNYSKIYFNNGKKMVVAKVLAWFEERLCSDFFIRIHRSHIINKAAITLYADSQVRLSNNDTITVARRKKVFFMEQWQMSAIA